MAAEYRAKFPGKAVINNVGHGAWIYACAGGSIPELPKTTDAKLLAAIPQMQPWAAASKNNCWALREAGKQFLISGGGEVDLSSESGTFRLNAVDSRTGKVTRGEQVLQTGGKVTLPGGVVWLTKE
jgi:hypothetical protein